MLNFPQHNPNLAYAPKPWALEVTDLSVTLGSFKILSDINLGIPARCQTVIIGPNGAGKSTLVLSLLGQLPHQGQVNFAEKNAVLGYVPQRLDFDRHLPMTTLEYLSLGLSKRPLWLGVSKKIRPQALELLHKVKGEDLIDRPIGALSGGELQRVLLASAISLKPHILILDEPATGVDIYGEQLLCELLDGLKGEFTIIMVSHDLPTAQAHADWVICLNRTLIAQGPPSKIFTPKIMAATFGLHAGKAIFRKN